jgi:hypothetical protein
MTVRSLAAIAKPSGKQDQFVLLGRSIGKVIAFLILPSEQTGFPNLEMSFTDRGLYFYNGQIIPRGTDAPYQGFLDEDLFSTDMEMACRWR